MHFLPKHLCFHAQPLHFAELLLNSKNKQQKRNQYKYSTKSV